MHFLYSSIVTIIIIQEIFCFNQTLGVNLVINSNLTEPSIYPSMYRDFGKEIKGWKTAKRSVQLLIFKIQKKYFPLFCPFPSAALELLSDKDQYLCTDSTNSNEYLYQTFNLTSNKTFLLSLNYAS